MKTKKERIFYYDFLRAFAIIAVIICHVDFFFGPLTTQTQVIAQMAFHDIGRIGVPIFLMISGALLLNREYNLSNYLKRRFTRKGILGYNTPDSLPTTEQECALYE